MVLSPPSQTERGSPSKFRQARLSQYARDTHPPPMQLTARDKHILEAIHAYDGILSDRQIQRLFFSGRSQMQLRTRLLYQNGYLERLDRRRRAALPFMLYWLARRGAAYVAGLDGTQLSRFAWRKTPRWSTVEHDVAANDVRIAVVQACRQITGVELETWVNQSEFWSQADRVVYTDGRTDKEQTRAVRPDGFCCIHHGGVQLRYLWEVDRRTEDNPRWVREKVYPLLAYLKSDAYVSRFGARYGRILTVTTGMRRLHNMKKAVEQAAGQAARHFAFTIFDRLRTDTVLSAPIWSWGHATSPRPLLVA